MRFSPNEQVGFHGKVHGVVMVEEPIPASPPPTLSQNANRFNLNVQPLLKLLA